MNLVETIQGKLSRDTVQQLSTRLGADAAQAEAAVAGAIPALLGGFHQLATTEAGATRLTDALGQVDETIGDTLADTMTGGGLSELIKQGSGLLSSVMGGSGLLSPIIGAISTFSGLSRGSTSGMMGVLAPVIMATLKQNLTGTVTTAGVQQLLASQQAHVASALPQGLREELGDVPGLGNLGALLGGVTAGAGLAGAASVSDAVTDAIRQTVEPSASNVRDIAADALTTAQDAATRTVEGVRDAALAGDIAAARAADTELDSPATHPADTLLSGDATHSIQAAVQDQIAEAVSSAEGSAGNLIQSAGQAAEDALDSAASAAEQATDALRDSASMVTGMAGNLASSADETITDGIDSAQSVLADAAEGVRQTLGGAGNRVSEAVDEGQEVMTDAAAGIRDTLSNVGETVQEGAQDTVNSLEDAASSSKTGSSFGRIALLGVVIVALAVLVVKFFLS